MKLCVCLALCLLGLVVAQAQANAPILTAEEITQRIAQYATRLNRIEQSLRKFKSIGVGQITKLRELILANLNCPALQGISAPEIPTAPPQQEPEPVPEGEVMSAQEASNKLHRIGQMITQLEQKIAKMKHVGMTQIEIFKRFVEATGGRLCNQDD